MEKDPKSNGALAAPEPKLFDGPVVHGRTFGLRAFDGFLYPGITNVGVFVISVFFTYLTNRGSQFGKTGSAARKFGELMQKRGDWVQSGLTNVGLSEKAASNARMVFWSFADGSLLAPVIKGFEDNREKIARNIDRFAGTQPDDPIVYTEEPRQSWGSVLGARALTAGIVVPVAVALETKNAAGKSFNDRWFYDNGLKFGQYVRKNAPVFSAKFNEGTFREISKVTLFEGFYTSVCTAGQYYISRYLASHRRKPEAPVQNAAPTRLKNLLQTPDTKLQADEREHEPPQQAQPSLSA